MVLPVIKDIEKFGTEWRSWYKYMQPKTRIGQTDWLLLKNVPTDLHEWLDLKRGSTKGFVLLLVTLSWWEAQATRKKDKLMVMSALQDVLFVVRQLAAQVSEDDTSALHKRTQASESHLPPNKR